MSGEEVINGKPNPEIFIKSAEMMGYKVEDCIVIEDSSNGVKAAKKAGMKCIGYNNINTGQQNLKLADVVINKFSKENFNIVFDL